ncbi:hypothetical protein L249_6044, partial [Ophiocordyceps polyrhachis-furcata BCC 54312]
TRPEGLGGSRDAGPAAAGPRPPYVTEAGLGGSRDAGPAAAGPRPPYVTEAERHNNVGGGYGYAIRLRLRLRQRLRPYGPYGPTGQARRAFFSNTISLRM